MDDFSTIVDAVGGIEVDVPFAMNDPKVLLSIPAGTQRMSGTVALQYVRSRSLDSDFGRATRQQALVLAMARTLANPAVVPDPAVVVSRLASLQTDLRPTDLAAAVGLVQATRDAQVTSIVLRPPRFTISAGLAGSRGWVVVPDVEEIRSWVLEATSD
jgi:anionic cell wall polymer biosynthesis LytR-Cps2A-Psr (LCP) family protein